MTNGKIEWPALHADLTAKRDALNQVLATIETHFISDGHEMPASPITSRVNGTALRKRTDGRTDGRSKARASRGSLPDVERITHGADILKVLRKGPMKPRDLAAAVHITTFSLRERLKKLATAKAIVITGKTSGCRVSLPHDAAKEAP